MIQDFKSFVGSSKIVDSTQKKPTVDLMSRFSDSISNLPSEFSKDFGGAISNVAESAKGFGSDLLQRGNTVSEKATQLGSDIANSKSVTEGLAKIGSFGGDVAGQFAGGVGDAFKRFFEASTSNITPEQKQAFLQSKPVQDISNAIPIITEGLKKGILGQDADTKIQSLLDTAQKYPEITSQISNAVSVIANLVVGGKAENATTKAIDTGIANGSELLNKGISTAENIVSKAKEIGGNIADTGAQGLVDTGKNILNSGKEIKQKLIDFASPEADDITKNVLKRSTSKEVATYDNLQKKALADEKAITPYDYVGDKMAEGAKLIDAKLKDIGAKKSEFVEPLRGGFEAFDTNPFVQKLHSLKNSLSDTGDKSFIDSVITKAENAKTKGQVDKLIDDVQGDLFKAKQLKTINSGSPIDTKLNGVIKEMNTELKKSLPKEYTTLNAKYSELKNALYTLNNALGEKVGGISTRGGSLIKQFFSPASRKAKELFAIIEKETGVDLAKEAVLAKYIMQLYGDTRANTLLGGNIPTSVSGIINKGVDIAVEKTGLGKKAKESIIKSSVNKAKRTAGKK
jgi:hypothetical protein